MLVYLPLFLREGFGWTAEATGMGLLAATAPMLVVPPFGGSLAVRLGLRGLFATALALLALGGGALVLAALAQAEAAALALAFAGMALLGIGAALSHSQLSGAVLALAPPEAGGMASAVTVIARQAGFALGVAGLGALMPSALDAGGFAWPFGVAAAASTCGLLACRLLPPSSSETTGARGRVPTNRRGERKPTRR